jgi:hypothetical protein
MAILHGLLGCRTLSLTTVPNVSECLVPKATRKTDYLFHKNGSPNWYIRLQRDGRDIIKSLGTSDKLTAEAKAASMIGNSGRAAPAGNLMAP